MECILKYTDIKKNWMKKKANKKKLNHGKFLACDKNVTKPQNTYFDTFV